VTVSRFDDATKARIDELVARYPNRKAALLPALWVAQEVYGGWLPEEAQAEVADYLGLPRAEVEGVATFYTMYNKKPVGKHHIEICHNVSCQVFGADDLIHYCEKKLGISAGETTPDGMFTLNRAECLGACCNPVAIQVGGKYYEDIKTEAQIDALIDKLRAGERPAFDTPQGKLPEARTFGRNR
jgi:NADH-quinone oxidoreductase, E subunit